MQVKMEDETYVVGWKYQRKKGKFARKTECYLGILMPKGSEKPVKEVGKVEIRYHSNSTPCKELARKYSLQKLLAKVAPGRGNKDLRRKVWNAYFSRKTSPVLQPETV